MSAEEINKNVLIANGIPISDSIPIKEGEFKIYKYRWVSVLAYGICVFVLGAAFSFYVPISPALEEIYGLSLFEVNMTSYPYFLLYPISSIFLANYIFSKHGTAAALYLGGRLLILGFWLRTCINYSFSLVVLGSICVGIAHPLLMNGPAKNSANWFSPHQRPIATTITTISCAVGAAVGFIFPSIFVRRSRYYDEEHRSKGYDDVYKASIFEAVLFTLLIAIAFVLFKEKPLTPPSVSAQENNRAMPLKKAFRQLMKNKEYLLISIQFWLLFLDLKTIHMGVAPIIQSFGFDKPIQSALIGLSFILVGLVGASLLSIFVAKTKKFKLTILIICIGSSIAFLAFFLTLYLGIYAITLMLSAILGFFLVPATAISIEFVCEVSYPIEEATCSGLTISCAQFISVLGVLACSLIADPATTTKKHITIFGICLTLLMSISIIIALCVNQKLRRLEHDLGVRMAYKELISIRKIEIENKEEDGSQA